MIAPATIRDYTNLTRTSSKPPTARNMYTSDPKTDMRSSISFQRFLVIAARTLMSVLFLASGTSKLTSSDFTIKYMEAYGVPGYLLYPAAGLELSTGTMLLLGVLLTEIGTVLSGWCLLTASIFHREWSGDDGQTQQIMFMKNLCMAGGFMMLAAAPHEHTSLVDVMQWAEAKLRTEPAKRNDDAEQASLLPKDMPPSYLYGGERRTGQIV